MHRVHIVLFLMYDLQEVSIQDIIMEKSAILVYCHFISFYYLKIMWQFNETVFKYATLLLIENNVFDHGKNKCSPCKTKHNIFIRLVTKYYRRAYTKMYRTADAILRYSIISSRHPYSDNIIQYT